MDWQKRRAATADWLSTHLQMDVRFYSRSFTWLAFGHASGVVRGLATTFLMVRWLPTVTLGQFRYILALFGIAGIFSMSGMSAAVIRGVAKGDTIVARVALKRILRIAPLGALALLLAAGERLWAGEPTVAMGLAIAAIAFTPYSVSGLYGSILTGQGKIKELTYLAVINNLVYAALFLALLRLDRSLVIVTFAYFGLDILFRGFLTLRELRRLHPVGSADTHVALGNHLAGINVMQAIAGQLDQVLVQRFGGYASLALFSVATIIPEQIKDFVNSIGGTLLQRKSTQQPNAKTVATNRRHFWVMMAGATAVIGVYALTAPILIPLLFPRYAEAVWLSVVYSIGLLALPTLAGQMFLQAHQQIKKLWIFYIVNTTVQIGANALLIPFYGVWGAVASKLASRFAILPLSYPTLDVSSTTHDSHTPARGTRANLSDDQSRR